MTKTAVPRKRFLWHPADIDTYYSDDYFSDEERDFKYGRPRPTPMASLLNLNLNEYELIRFYNNESTPLLVAATGKNEDAQGLWMANVTKLASSNNALKEICMAFATMHMGHNRKKSIYILKDGREHPKTAGPLTDLTRVAGYTRLEEEVLEQMFIRLTNAVKAHQLQIVNMTLESYESVLLSSVLIYLHAMSMGPFVPLFSFDGGVDLFSLGRTIHDLTFIYSDKIEPSNPFNYSFGEDSENDREKLPREEDMWAIIDFVDTDVELSVAEKRRIKRSLTAELNNLIMLFHMDREALSVSHISAWCTFWTPSFFRLLREEHNTYALLFVCYWCGYAHMWHILFWWGDRIQEDLLNLKDHLPERVHHFLEWPLQSCTRFDINYVDLLNGKMRQLYI
ncbi:hypothetical protein B0I72DRAFT_141318 [Yarrowia lipolytica]|uniref:YALI0E05577p n=3 Tax=Yarrowia lipolytica TaxID=4952 RepID=Q6C6X1_YARLI|nr:YALI0E05577p [Yarrowia lipolytica CLIB122]KAB8286182.1 hypothetical protein BKA91DRAFT_132064 [Yarrowia lipolytica]KAE8171505.1 hypothetical protein BKA90DRAFT_138890 [Yarrowia lipolytica]KAJ8056569.1 hypothetical protein LXG23DRAFT_33463 [Yarrowia lipolytica]QNP98808.1 Hypothetical protein YALI2_E00124g [Yarrowia lipolytica]RDW23164.1 hypothetical protein B0I71DRAFT_136397 [Yarrowia lipolytica]|eukprot:XP_503591.1 YALI0E05577p [Yarrowia lipolytica CLIB122]